MKDSNQATKIPFSVKYLVKLWYKSGLTVNIELPFTANLTAQNIHSHYAQDLLSNLGIETPSFLCEECP